MQTRQTRKQLMAVLFLGFSSGLPFALAAGTLTARYTEAGVSILAIGALSLLQFPYLLKPLWAPILDRVKPLPLKRRRAWILLMQILMVVVLVLMSRLSAASHPLLLAYAALGLVVFSATFDVSYDAYRTDVLPARERGMGASMVSLGFRAALLVSGAFALVLAGYIGFQATYLWMAVVMASMILVTLCSPDPECDDVAPPQLRHMWREPLANLGQRHYLLMILIFVVLYKLCDAFALSLSTTFLLRGVGFSLAEVGSVVKTVSVVATLAGALLGGWSMRRLSLWRALFYFGILQAVSNAGYLLLAIVGKHMGVMVFAVFVEYFCGGLVTVAFVAYLTALCDRRFSATQYALLSALASLGRVLIGPAAAWVEIWLGWQGYFIVSMLLGIPPLLMLSIWRQHIVQDDLVIGLFAGQP